jgi:hypothetical protein
MRIRSFAALAVLLVPIGATAAVKLPPNATAAGRYLDTVDFSYPTSAAVPFAKLKLCIAESVSND